MSDSLLEWPWWQLDGVTIKVMNNHVVLEIESACDTCWSQRQYASPDAARAIANKLIEAASVAAQNQVEEESS